MKHLIKAALLLALIPGVSQAAVKLYSQSSQPASCNSGDMWIDTDGTSGERVYTCETNTWVKNLGVGPTSNPSFLSLNVSGGNLAAANAQVTKKWITGLGYTANLTSVIYGGKHYICTSTHTAGSTTEPGVGASWATVWAEVTGSSVGAIDDLTDVDTTGKATGKILKFDASGNLVVGTDDTGSGSVPSGTVNGQILQWSTDQWVAGAIPTLNQNTTGSAATLTTARTIGGVSFNGSANINLPGVNASGTQNTSGNAGTATALAANGANCSAGQAALGVNASGAAEGCWTPSAGSMSWPAAAGIAVYGGSSAWGTSLTLDTDASTVSGSDDSLLSAKAIDAVYAKKTGISYVAGALSDMKILDTAQPVNGSVWVDDTLAYGATDDQLHLWSIDKVGSLLAAKQDTAGAAYPITSSSTTASTTLNIDGAAADHYYYSNGSTAATYSLSATSRPAVGTERYVYLTLGGGTGLTTLTNSGIDWAGGATPTTLVSESGKTLDFMCTIKNTGNPLCSTLNNVVAVTVATEVNGSASATLTSAQVSGTIITNQGMGGADVALTLPTAAAGYNALFTVGTAQSFKWGVRAGTNDKIYLLAADGTVAAGADNGYARMTAAQVGQAFACWTFQTGAGAWDWQCKAGAIGTSTFAAN